MSYPTHRHPLTVLAVSTLLTGMWLPEGVKAQTTPLPDYVIEYYAAPPVVPAGPLSDELARAVQIAFVHSIQQTTWGPEQSAALDVIAASGDPRLAWIITDLMRFVPQQQLRWELSHKLGMGLLSKLWPPLRRYKN